MTCYIRTFFALLANAFILGATAQGKDTLINTYFQYNSDSLDINQVNLLHPLFCRILSIKQITGYADSTGSNVYNLNLSRRRSINVTQLFNQLNIPLKNSPGYKGEDGKQDPLMWKNRRVEIVAVLRDAPLVHIQTDNDVVASINLDNIYFIPDMARITEESLPYIDELVTRLKKNYKTGHFEIVGHVNYQSKRDSSQLRDLYMLSERRARAVYELLVQKGIPAIRMEYKGVGNSQPLIEQPTNEEEKKKNMRVQVIVTRQDQ